ncbi:hypothetical protein M413DRAFT_448138 [Hebeloma cylindrosporum]|uniref:Uncharacterized protein n=1 Tax=Hebeloma cylindrosporum TaxID=76867 RepID=A0A0C3C2L3_HEBCY|nr:hypothetical protein M413DRAFT_448138 [Hebeloma cylindrosporum h7]
MVREEAFSQRVLYSGYFKFSAPSTYLAGIIFIRSPVMLGAAKSRQFSMQSQQKEIQCLALGQWI